ncbi:DUF427 domain-containing protein [Nitratireductor luteus]|uniref:DUF427 domain-containing protein n=1 Tax=Nitratireductor luteus TaxID=2976980 RepID=UPI00223F5909|nr:DUF427 domain-containing protein [Nitratireductor luteus]
MTETRRRITVVPYKGTVNVRFSDAIIASTGDALVLHEEGREPVFYIPSEHIYFEFLRPSETRTRCPLKGEARYWGVEAVGEAAHDVMWIYETPYEQARQIAGYGAFDPEKVMIEATPDESPRETTDMV